MFRGIVKGLGELFKKRGSVEMSELPRVSNPIQQALGQNQPPPIQSSSQQNVSLENSSAAATQNTFRRSSTANSLSRLATSGGINPSQLAEMKAVKRLSQDNWVRVRIWTSKAEDGQDAYSAKVILNRVKGLEANIGHATLETNGIYASIWPDPRRSSGDPTENPSLFVDSAQDDITAEKDRKPDYIFEFYSLNIPVIEKLFQQIKEAKEPWTLFGDALGDKGYSCSSLTLALLEKGGLNNLATPTIRGIVSPTSNFVVSPNNLVNQLNLAKKLEEKLFPEIIDFNVQEKTNPSNKTNLFVSVKTEKVTIFNLKDPVIIQDNNNLSNKFSR